MGDVAPLAPVRGTRRVHWRHGHLASPPAPRRPPSPTELFAPVGNEVELCYQTFGDPDGEPLLLVMGLGGPMTWWDHELCADARRSGLLRRPLRQPRHRSLEPRIRAPGHAAPAGPRLRRPAGPGAVLDERPRRRRRRAARPPRPRVRARRGRLDGRHDRPDRRDRAPAPRAVADQHHVDDRPAHGRLAGPRACCPPLIAPRKPGRESYVADAASPSGTSSAPPTTPPTASALARAGRRDLRPRLQRQRGDAPDDGDPDPARPHPAAAQPAGARPWSCTGRPTRWCTSAAAAPPPPRSPAPSWCWSTGMGHDLPPALFDDVRRGHRADGRPGGLTPEPAMTGAPASGAAAKSAGSPKPASAKARRTPSPAASTSRLGHQPDHAAAEPAAGHPGAERAGRGRASTAVSTSGTVMRKSSRIEACEAVRSGPMSGSRPSSSSRDTCEHAGVLGHDVADVAPQLVVVQPGERGVEVVGRTSRSAGTPSRRAASSQPRRRAPYSPSEWRCGARVSTTSTASPAAGEVEAAPARVVVARACRRTARARPRPRRLTSWSIPPVGAPTASFSTSRRQGEDRVVVEVERRGGRRPRARPSRPAPPTTTGRRRSGTSESTSISQRRDVDAPVGEQPQRPEDVARPVRRPRPRRPARSGVRRRAPPPAPSGPTSRRRRAETVAVQPDRQGEGQDEAVVVVGVLTDEVDASGREPARHDGPLRAGWIRRGWVAVAKP